MYIIKNQKLDEERALYGLDGVIVENSSFDGPADGESALKECKNVTVRNTFCNLRYPFWHDDGLVIEDSEMTEPCRAGIWYSKDIRISNTQMYGIKALRECANVNISNSDIISPEFGWSVRGLEMVNSTVVAEYFMMRSSNLKFDNVKFKGKYSFQYVENAEIRNSDFDTKDAFWHSKNVTVRDTILKGEYLAWYAENLTLINCKIIGTQPFCYCKGLKLINCETENTDLAFEKSEVEATITTHMLSIKNPLSGIIKVKSVGEIIRDEPWSEGKIIITNK